MKCCIVGCDRDAHVKSRQLCTTHYSRWWKWGDTSTVKPPGRPAQPRPQCKFPGCEKLTKRGARGWCGMHYTRWFRHGDPGRNGNDHRTTVPAIFRVLARVVHSDTCWLWPGPKLPTGYGTVGVGTRGRRANDYVHRVVWRHFRGDIPPGMQVHHTCMVRHCCNPDHLELVTPKQHAARHLRARGRAETSHQS